MSLTKTTILLFGATGSGKTAQIGILAEHIFRTTGKKTRLYTADKGGTKTIQPYIKLGIIEPIEILETNPWIFLDKSTKGFVRDEKGKWVAGDFSSIGMVAFESFRSFAEELLMWQAEKAGEGISIGGGSNISFQVQGDGETLKVGGGNVSHYKVAQDRMTSAIWRSQKLPVPYILWTTSVSKEDGQLAVGKVLGPDVIGKALTEETPRWFQLTLHITVLPAAMGKAERHLLHLGTHQDASSGNATAMGNIRQSLDAPVLKSSIIEPANIVDALTIIEGGYDPATAAIAARCGLKV